MRTQQVHVVLVTIEEVMRSSAFQRGVREVRRGLPPRYDEENSWDYERGRLWGKIAPRSMQVVINGRLNPKAVNLYKKCGEERQIF